MGKILIVDDSSIMRRIIKRVLKEVGLNEEDMIEAADGIEGWEQYNKYRDEIDLITLDVNMPNMNGFELLEKIREDELKRGKIVSQNKKVKIKTKNGVKELNIKYDLKSGNGVKIIMITTEGGKESVLTALAKGANSYIVKPFKDEKEVRKKLEELKIIWWNIILNYM